MVPYLRAANVNDGELDLTDVKSMNFDPAEQKRFALRPGDVLVTEGSGSLSTVGASAVWKAEVPGTVCFQNTLLRLRPNPSTDSRYLAWWCRHAFADGLFASVATGANIFHISAERVRSISMTYLPLEDQRAIADYLDTETARIDALITKKRRMIDLLEERRDRELDRCAIPGLDHEAYDVPSDAPGHQLPAGWTAPPIGALIKRITYGFANPMPTSDEGPLMLTANDIADGQVLTDAARRTTEEAFQALTAKSRPETGDVLITKDGSLGRVAIFDCPPACVNQSVAVLTPHKRLISAELLALLLRIPLYRDALLFEAGGTTIKHLYITRITKQRLALPPAGEREPLRRLLGEIIERSETASSILTHQIDLLAEHRQALITAAVTGEFRVPGAA